MELQMLDHSSQKIKCTKKSRRSIDTQMNCRVLKKKKLKRYSACVFNVMKQKLEQGVPKKNLTTYYLI